jgi:tetratricopeptide (TPR) repeat protein
MNHMLLNDFDSVWNNFRDSDESTKALLCRQYALLKLDLYTELRNLSDLEEAIEKARWAVTGSDESWLLNLGAFLWKRYECTKNFDDAEEAITLTRQATSFMAVDDPACIGGLSNLSTFLTNRYERLGKIEDLEEAIQIIKKSLDVPDLQGDPDFAQKLKRFTQNLNSFGNLLRYRYERFGKIYDVDDAIEVARDVVSFTPVSDADRPTFLNNLGLALNCKYEASKDVEVLEEAIQIGREAVRLTGRDDLDLPAWLSNLGMYLGHLYERTARMNTLEEAIKVMYQGIDILPQGHADLAGISNNLGTALQNRYDITKKTEDLDEAIRMVRQAIALTAVGSPQYVAVLPNLGALLMKQYDRTESATDLTEAIQIDRRVVNLTPRDHPMLAQRMNNLAVKLGQRYDCENNLNDLQEAVKFSRDAHEITPEEGQKFQHSWNTLAAWLGRLHERTGVIDHLKEAIHIARRVAALMSHDNPEYAGMLHNLGCYLRSEYELTGERDCLEEAVQLTTKAVELTQEGSPHRAIFLNSMGLALSNEFQVTGDMDLLDQAIEVIRKAVDLRSEDRPGFIQFIGFLNNLAIKLSWRFTNTGEVRDLDEAIRIARRVISLSSADQPSYGWYLNNLGNYLRHRYESSGEIEDIKEAIQLARQAIDSTDADDPKLPGMYDNLASQLFREYEHTGTMDFLEEAIQLRRHSIGPDTAKTDLADFLRSMASYLNCRYLRTSEPSDIEEAIQVSRKAVDITPEDHPGLAARLGTLGDILGHRYERRGNEDDLKEALELAHKTIDITPNDHPRLIWALNNLGIQLSRGYDRTNNDDYLDEALQVAQRTIDITPSADPDLAAHFYNLASNLSRRYERRGTEVDLEQAVRAAIQSWDCSHSPPFVRLKSSALALHLLRISLKLEDAYILSRKVLDFIPHVHRRSLTIADQQYIATHFSGFATDACSLALQVGQPAERALEELERGRGVILSLLMDDRSDISHLEAEHPELHAQYEALRLQLSNPPQKTPNKKPSYYLAEKRAQIAIELEKCVEDIQQLPGFQNFFKGLTSKQIEDCAAQGNILVVNITRLRSDALIVTPNAIQAFPLPDLRPRDAFDWIKKDLTATNLHDRGRKNKEYRDFLAWLWRTCVKPVLDHIGYSAQSSTNSLPRVWWIGTGLASSFPFHAANNGSGHSLEHSRFRVISSYTTTIKALKHSRERSRIDTLPSSDRPHFLVIAMPETPGADDLPGARAEISEVRGSIGNSAAVEILECPDVASSLSRLEHCSIAHFACHGISNYNDPSQSGLILQRAKTATEKPSPEVLTVQRVFQAHFSKPQIAYLSACSTAQNEADRLEDEVLHAVSGFQVAGFKHVLGCMWPSDDSICVKVAKSFYTSIGQSHNLWKDDRAVALAMHNAVLAIQESVEYRKRPLLWAQYVHFGA